MAPRPTLSAAFPVHSYEVDAFGALEVPALSGYLQEVAGRHAAELGVGIEALRAKGLSWILARQRIELPLAIAMGDMLEIETWPSGFDRLGAVREFVVRRADGAEAARATTVWYVLDLSTRKVVRPHDVLDPRLPRERGTSVSPIAHAKLPELERFEHEKRFRVRYGDIDGNFHVTNASYVAGPSRPCRWSSGGGRACARSRSSSSPRSATARPSCRGSRRGAQRPSPTRS
jgi:acyl-ACP thioesterase